MPLKASEPAPNTETPNTPHKKTNTENTKRRHPLFMITQHDSKTILTVKELAEYLRIGRDSAYGLVRSGQIRSVRIGRQIRIPRAAVDAYLSGETKACQDASQQV